MNFQTYKKPLSSALLLSFVVSSTQLQAMPTFNSARNERLSRAQTWAQNSNEVLKGVQLLQDDLNPNVLYVTPSTKKTQAGVYSPVNGAVNCPVFQTQFNLTYKMPPEDQWQTVAAAGVYSPFFDVQYGNYYRFGGLINKLSLKLAEASEYTEKPEYAAYMIAKERLELKTADLDEVKAALTALDQAVATAAALLSVASPDEIEAAKTVLTQAAADRKERAPALLKSKIALEAEVKPLQDAYLTAKQAWMPYDIDFKKISEAVANIQTSMQVVDSVARDVWGRNLKTLEVMETKVVGTAFASYSIWGNETSAMQAALTSGASPIFSPSYAVRALPIFNVALQSTIADNPSTAGISGSDGNSVAGGALLPRTISLKASAAALLARPLSAAAKDSERWAFRGNDNQPLRVGEDESTAGNGTFKAEINQGVYCMGSSDRGPAVPRAGTITIAGTTSPYVIDTYLYRPRSQRVMAQSVALRYSYHVQSDPISVVCNMNVNNMNNYMRDKGEWHFLWWGEQWDNINSNQSARDSLKCVNKQKPSDSAPGAADAQARAAALQNKASNEIMVEYLTHFARSWTTEIVNTPMTPQQKSKFFANIGTGLEAICGPNTICRITSVVLKGLDEIAGSDKSKQKIQQHFSGNISRDYSEQSFRTLTGYANIDVTVDAP